MNQLLAKTLMAVTRIPAAVQPRLNCRIADFLGKKLLQVISTRYGYVPLYLATYPAFQCKGGERHGHKEDDISAASILFLTWILMFNTLFEGQI